MRKKIIAGNWKMNLSLKESTDLVQGIHYGLRNPGDVEVIVAPVFTAIHSVSNLVKDSFIGVAGQNISHQKNGAFTGEISAEQLKDAGAEYVILGHSERRQFYGETNEIINLKIKRALETKLIPIFCVGETLSERESGKFESVIEEQIFKGLTDVATSQLIVAYEPVWAIGTGKSASPQEAEEAHQFVRGCLQALLGKNIASEISILYGGSVKASNSKELLGMSNIDGALIGGASLIPAEFISIIKSV